MRIQLIGGAYSPRSRIAACTRSINYYPEKNPEGTGVSSYTHYQCPGLLPLVQPGDNKKPVRQVYRASNDDGYCVIGQSVYFISPLWILTKLGDLQTQANTPVYFIDNGTEIMLTDGSPVGYVINMNSHAFAPLLDPDGFFERGGRCDTIDGFILWAVNGTRKFKSTLDNQIAPFDLTYVASKAGYPDLIQTLIINRRQILLLGSLKSEIWYNVGGAQFPFAEVPGTYIEHGAAGPYSAASSDVSVFWVGQDLQGVGYIFRQQGYDTKIISNYAISNTLKRAAKANALTNSIGFTYTQGGHAFYVLQFPELNETWVFDDSLQDTNLGWHQRAWTDGQGVLQRDRSNCAAWLYGRNVVGDWENGTLYALDTDVYTDTVDGTVYAKSFIRTFPHIPVGQVDPQGVPPVSRGQQVKFSNFTLDFQCGEGEGGPVNALGVPTPDQVWLRWSADRGKTWGQSVLQSTGVPGEYATSPKWSVLGAARDMIFEIGHSIRGEAAINAAWVDAALTGN